MRDNTNLTSGVITTDISDHYPVFNLIGKHHSRQLKPKYVKCRQINDDNIQNIANHLKTINWTNSLENLNVNEASTKFIDTLKCALDKFSPEKNNQNISQKCT